MRILITGAAGYIGCQLVRLLKQEFDLVLFDDLTYNQGPLVYPTLSGLKFYKENVCKMSPNLIREVQEADIIIPLAAYVGAPLCQRQPILSEMINYKWFEEIIKYISEDQTLIFPNTNSAYGTVPGICTEDTPTNPISLYGKQKQKAEELLRQEVPKSICFRLATVFGWSPRPRLDLLINSLTYEAFKTGKIKVFDGNYRRNYIHVRDIAEAFRFAILNKERMHGEVFNLGHDEINMTKMELAQKIAKISDSEVLIDNSKTDPDKRDYNVSSQKLYKLGFTPYYNLESGVKEMLDFYKYVTEPKSEQMRNY